MGNKRNIYLTVLAVLLIALGLLSSLFRNDSLGDRVINVIPAITAVIGAIALFYQFKKDKNLNEASFLVEYSVSLESDLQHDLLCPGCHLGKGQRVLRDLPAIGSRDRLRVQHQALLFP